MIVGAAVGEDTLRKKLRNEMAMYAEEGELEDIILRVSWNCHGSLWFIMFFKVFTVYAHCLLVSLKVFFVWLRCAHIS